MTEGGFGTRGGPDDPDDGAAAAREQRHREREQRRLRSSEPPADEPQQEPTMERPLPSEPPPPPARPPREPGRSRKDRLGGSLGIAAVAIAVVLLLFAAVLFQPFHGSPGDPVVLTIPKGSSAGDVGALLDDEGIVTSGALFQARLTLAGKRSELLPGTYTLHEGESYGDAIDLLTTPPEQRGTVTATIPEGLSRSQIAPLSRQAGLEGSYVDASVRSRFLHPGRYGAKGARNLEGFLFPNTYQLKSGAPASDLVQLQLQDFRRQVKRLDMRYARSKNLTIYDVVIIASMIEREVQLPRERKLVAAVVYNRLSEGMPLGIDATIRFAVGNYTTPLTTSQLESPSPYNTRLRAGLPPGPIGNPGLAALDAAAHPAKVGYRFYVVRPGTCGEHNFSTAEDEFLRDQAAYQQALEAKGASPTSC